MFECQYGTQCDRVNGCGPRAPLNENNEICSDSCIETIRGGVKWEGKARNGRCEDGGDEKSYDREYRSNTTGKNYYAVSGCGFGTDCTDCGVRVADMGDRVGVSQKDYALITDIYFHGDGVAPAPYSNDVAANDDENSFTTFQECMARCNRATSSSCQYAVWARDKDDKNAHCEDTNGANPYGAPSEGTARCFLYSVYVENSLVTLQAHLGCIKGTYTHASMNDARLGRRERIRELQQRTSLIFLPPPLPPTPPPPFPPPRVPPPSPPPSPSPPPQP